MDAYKSRYASETYTMCGIPSITLLGSESDWQRMVELAITVIDAIHALQPITLGVGRLMRAERPLDAGAWLFVYPAHNFCVACGASTTWSHELCQRCKSQRGPQASVCLHARACRFIIYIHTHTHTQSLQLVYLPQRPHACAVSVAHHRADARVLLIL